MRIAVIGAGGVGGYYGGLLARAGNEVALIARGSHLEAIRAAGLRVESVHGDLKTQPALATSDPAEVGPVDLVIFAVKTYDLETAGSAARPLLGPQTVVLPLENGLDAPDMLGQLLGAERILPGVTYISSSIAAPGVIRQVSAVRRIVLGEPQGGTSPRAERIGEALSASGIEAIVTDDVQAALWCKFVLMAPTAGVCTAARLPLSAVLACTETRALYLQALEETSAVGRAEGVELPPDIIERTRHTSEGFPPGTRPSMLVDLEAGRRLELEALNGAVVRRGEAGGVATPMNRALYALLKPWAGGSRS